MHQIAEGLDWVIAGIAGACERAGRDVKSVELIAVSKYASSEKIQAVINQGHLAFGESRFQDALPKIKQLPAEVQWHFVGRIQSNKVRKVIQNFRTIHSVDSLRLASLVNCVASELHLSPRIFLEVNIGGEISKTGFTAATLKAAMPKIVDLHRIQVVGLMCIPPANPEAEQSRKWFALMRDLRDSIESDIDITIPGLSMGMSNDFQIAIEEGATHVRVGSKIFAGKSSSFPLRD